MPTLRKPTPRKAAYKAVSLPTSTFEADRRIPLIILAAIAAIMAIVLLFTRCTAPADPNMPAPGEAAVVSADAEAEESLEYDVEEPDNPSAKASLEDYTWEELAEISEKISDASSQSDAIYVAKQYRLVTPSGKLDGTATKSIKLANGSTAAVRIIGFNHDSASDGSGKAGISFQFTDSVGTMAVNEDGTSAGGWPASSLSYYLGVEFWNQLPEDLTGVITEVRKSSNTGAENSTTETGDVMWLPSYIELVGQVDTEFQASAATLTQEGSQYQLFADTGVSASDNNSLLVVRDDGQASAWWLRTADIAHDNSFYYVNAAGHPTDSGAANQEYALVPCFSV